jgi:flagellar biosynthesis protein FliR
MGNWVSAEQVTDFIVDAATRLFLSGIVLGVIFIIALLVLGIALGCLYKTENWKAFRWFLSILLVYFIYCLWL